MTGRASTPLGNRLPRSLSARPRPTAAAGFDTWYITGFLLVLAAPPELQFNLGSLVLSPQRVFLLIAIVPALSRVVSDPRLGLRVPDVLMIVHVLWAWIAVAKVHGLEFSVQPGGIYVVELFGSYVLGRALMSSMSNMACFAKRQLQIICILALFTIPEALTHRHYLRELFGMVFGGAGGLGGVDRRLGMTRAFGTFDHPILYGVFCASAIGFAWYLAPTPHKLGWPRIRRAGTVIVAAFVSVSSGPLVACTAQIGIILWDVATRGIQKRWWMLLSSVGFVFVMLESLSNRGALTVFISYLTFNPTTGYNRKMIWQWGMAEVRQNPIFGIGFNAWTTPPRWWHGDSVDAFWLLTGMRYGLPGALSLITICLLTAVQVTRVRDPRLKPIAMAWLVSFIGLSIAAVAVHFWGSVFMLFSFLLGFGVSLSSMKTEAVGIRLPAAREAR